MAASRAPRFRYSEHFEAARRLYVDAGGGVARIGDHAGNMNGEVGPLERRLPQAEGRKDECHNRPGGRNEAAPGVLGGLHLNLIRIRPNGMAAEHSHD